MKTYFFAVLLIYGAFIMGFAQESIDLEVIHKIRQEGLNNSEIEDLAFHLTDATGPRLTNSPGHRRAGDWAVDQLTEWGLDASKEYWGEFGRGWEVKKSYVAMTKPYYLSLISVPQAWTKGLDAPISGKVILLDIKDEEDFDRYRGKISGGIVLIPSSADTGPTFESDGKRYTPEELYELSLQSLENGSGYSREQISQYLARRTLRRKISEFLIEEQARLVITGSRGKHGTLFTNGGDGYKEEVDVHVTEVNMAPEHADLMARLIAKGEEVQIEAEIETAFYEDELNSFNVIGELKGTDRKIGSEIVMLGGHLDSWHAGTGAVDNAAGCAVMMEAVRILKEIGYTPRRTIRIALWSGEEQGLFGSRNYVKQHFADHINREFKPEYDLLSAYYNIDNGTGRIRGIYLQGNDMARPVFEEWFKPLDDLIENRTVTIRNTSGTDHLSFDNVGLPGFQFIQDPIEYDTRTWHTNMDTYERLLIPDLKQMAVIVATMVYLTSERESKVPRKPFAW